MYNAVGQVAARVQLSGTERITTTYAYDALDRVITTTNALGHTSVTDYDTAGRRAASRDALGNQTTYTYDAVGQLLATADALGGVTTYTYDALGRRTAVTDALNHATITLYDAAGRVASQIDALNGVTQYTYDALGRRIAVTDPSGVTTYSGYDAAGRLSYTQDALGHATVTTYDALGRQLFVTDALSQVTRYEYDAAGRLSAVTTNYVPGGPEDAQTNLRTSYTYDALGAYTHVTDPLQHTTVYTYDGAGRRSAQQDALGYVTTYGYDALGRRVSVTQPDAAGPQTTTTHYDVLGRAIRVDYPANGDAEAFSVYHAYDALGRRSAMTDTTGVTTWTYDALGRVSAVSDPFTGTVAYGYDAAGNRTALTVTTANSELRIANYEFDAVNRLISVTDWATGTTTYGYDAAGRILTTTLPNGVSSVYDYDAAGRQVGLQHVGITGTLATYTYTLDALGRQVAVAESLRAGAGLTVTTRVIDHTFDGAGRLTHSAYSTGEAFAYQYDDAGNRTAMTSTTPLSGTVVTTHSYDAANRLTARSRSDGHSYTYDWSPRGQLLTEWTQGYPVREFTYDGAGRMIQARVFTQTTEFVYNGLGARLAVSVDGYGTTLYTLDYAANHRILAETTPTSTVSYLYGHECLGEQREGEWLYYLHDAEGYVRQGADADGVIVSAWLFDPDGTVLEGPNGPVSHLICGGVYDWSTGLIYRGGRYFDPNLGIWLALTPLLVVQGWRKRKDKRQWVLLVCVGLFVVGSLAGCEKPESTTMLSPLCTPTAIPGLGSGTGTPDPRTRTPPPPTETPSPPPDSIGAPPGGPPPTPDPCGRITPEAIAQAGGMENYLWRESDTCTLTRVSMGESHENGPDRVLIMWLIKMRAELGFGNAPHRGWNPPHDRWGEPTSIKQEALDPKQFDSVAKAYATIDPEAWPETGNIRAMLSPTDNQLPNFQSTLQIAAEIAVQPLSSIPDHLKGYDEFRAFELGRGWIGAKQTESLAGANYYRDAYWIDNIHFGLISCESVRENNKVDFQCPGTPAP